MAVPVIMPKMEMSQETAVIIEWLREEGQPVHKGEPLLVVETDKVTVEIESPGDGILAGIKASPGEVVPVTTVIAHLLKPGEELPEEGVSLVTVESQSADQYTIHPPHEVRVTPLAKRIAGREGLDLASVIGSGSNGQITKNDVQAALHSRREPSDLPVITPAPVGSKLRATPAARRLAREHQVDLVSITGTGFLGRIQGTDVQAYITSSQQKPTVPYLASQEVVEYEAIPFNGMRRTIADRMQASYQTTPHITFTSRVDMTEFEAVRTRLNFRAEAANGPHVTITALAVKLVAWALQNHPWLNSTLRGEEIHLMKRIHVGFAVAISEGLIVPVVHDADKKSVSQIASDVNDLSERARAGKLTPSDVVGGTFTISNLGPFGIEQFTAVINPGQAGILAIGAVQQEMVVVDGIAKIRPILRMTLSVDHRLVDGVVAARFLSDLRQAFETPSIVLW